VEDHFNGGIMNIVRESKTGFFLALVATLLLTIGHADAAVSCHKINATAVGQDNFDLTTRADISGGGLLNGTTASTLVATGLVFPDLSFAGTIVLTTRQGSVTAAIAGTLDLSTGAFSAMANVTSGTGKLADATGTLSLVGVEDLNTGRFVEDIGGILCADLSP
jgi:hypothetical protein